MGAYRYLLESSPGFTLGAALEFTESDFREDFADVWHLDADFPPEGMDHDDWLACRRVYGMARQVADVAMLLVRRKGIGPQRLAVGEQLHAEARAHDRHLDELLEAVRPHLEPKDFARVQAQLDRPSADDPRSRRGIFVNTLQLAARSIFPPTLDEVALRIETLVKYAVGAQNERTNAFLGRVATCYCLGLRTELAVMARAVLDTALQEVVPDEPVRQALGLPKRERVGLSSRLRCIDAFDLIRGDARHAMDRLKRAGDDAVHTSPGLEPQPDSIMRDLLAALSAADTLRQTQGRPPDTPKPG
jgi:hypothetical protein